MEPLTLEEFFQANPAAALAFSGGTDSAYLLYAARQAGANVGAYYVHSAFQPRFELADARRLAGELGVELNILELDVLADPQVASNPPDRCYFCKKQIFSAVRAAAEADGFTLLLDGTNASDRTEDRPGMRALGELSVRSPLRECGITKAEVRRRSREAGLFTWDKPAYACLATRIPTGEAIDGAALRRTEAAEEALSALGFRDFRVRKLGDYARLQLRPEQLPLLLERRQAVLEALKDYGGALLDLEVRGES